MDQLDAISPRRKGRPRALAIAVFSSAVALTLTPVVAHAQPEPTPPPPPPGNGAPPADPNAPAPPPPPGDPNVPPPPPGDPNVPPPPPGDPNVPPPPPGEPDAAPPPPGEPDAAPPPPGEPDAAPPPPGEPDAAPPPPGEPDAPPPPPAEPEQARENNAAGGFSYVLPGGWQVSDATQLSYGQALLTKIPPPGAEQPPNDTSILLGRLDLRLFAGAETDNAKAADRLASDMGEFFMPFPGTRVNQETLSLDAEGMQGAASSYEVEFTDENRPNGQIWAGVVGAPTPPGTPRGQRAPDRWFVVWLGSANNPVDQAAATTLAESIRPWDPPAPPPADPDAPPPPGDPDAPPPPADPNAPPPPADPNAPPPPAERPGVGVPVPITDAPPEMQPPA